MTTEPRTRLRLARHDDVEPLHTLIAESIEAAYAPVYPPRALPFFRRFHEPRAIAERIDRGAVLVAETGERLVATGSFVEGEITGLFVRPGLARRGLGTALMRALEARAIAAGVTESVLSVSIPARAFYERLGYRMAEARSRDLGDDQTLEFWIGRKPLTPTLR